MNYFCEFHFPSITERLKFSSSLILFIFWLKILLCFTRDDI